MNTRLVLLIALVPIFIFNVSLLFSSEYVQDAFKIKEVFLLPDLNVPQAPSIAFNYFNDNLYVINNEYTFSEDSISFSLFKSESNSSYKEYILTIPRAGFSERMHIPDLYLYKDKLYLLEFGYLIEFEIKSNAFKYKSLYKLNNSCSEIIKIDSNEATLTLNYITSDVYEDKKINFIYKINLQDNNHSIINFDNSQNYKLINVGPRTNKIFIDDTTCIFSDIVDFNFNIETYEGIKRVTFKKENWKSDEEVLDDITVDYKKQKNSFYELMDYNLENSSIYGLFKIDNYILVTYVINSKENKEYYYDILEYNKLENSLTIVKENLKNYNLDSTYNFGIEKVKLGKYLKVNDNYLFELMKFPFTSDVTFKDKSDFTKRTEEVVVDEGMRYSVVVRELK